jgi:hypothetical protein
MRFVLLALDRRRYRENLIDLSELCQLVTMNDFSISYLAIVFSKKESDVPEEGRDLNNRAAKRRFRHRAENVEMSR